MGAWGGATFRSLQLCPAKAIPVDAEASVAAYVLPKPSLQLLKHHPFRPVLPPLRLILAPDNRERIQDVSRLVPAQSESLSRPLQ